MTLAKSIPDRAQQSRTTVRFLRCLRTWRNLLRQRRSLSSARANAFLGNTLSRCAVATETVHGAKQHMASVLFRVSRSDPSYRARQDQGRASIHRYWPGGASALEMGLGVDRERLMVDFAVHVRAFLQRHTQSTNGTLDGTADDDALGCDVPSTRPCRRPGFRCRAGSPGWRRRVAGPLGDDRDLLTQDREVVADDGHFRRR